MYQQSTLLRSREERARDSALRAKHEKMAMPAVRAAHAALHPKRGHGEAQATGRNFPLYKQA